MTTPDQLPNDTVVDDFAILCAYLGGTPDNEVGTTLAVYSQTTPTGRMNLARDYPHVASAWRLWMSEGGPWTVEDYLNALAADIRPTGQQ